MAVHLHESADVIFTCRTTAILPCICAHNAEITLMSFRVTHMQTVVHSAGVEVLIVLTNWSIALDICSVALESGVRQIYESLYCMGSRAAAFRAALRINLVQSVQLGVSRRFVSTGKTSLTLRAEHTFGQFFLLTG